MGVLTGMMTRVADWLRDCIENHKLRILLGLVVFIAEAFLFLETGVLEQEIVNFHSGEGSWQLQLTAENPEICQEFTPQYEELSLFSVLVYQDAITMQDGGIKLVITDSRDEIVFEKELGITETENGRFTDMEADLDLSSGKKYYLSVVGIPSSLGEYPAIGVCGSEYELPENGKLVWDEELSDTQLVSRYHYVGALTSSKVLNALFLSLITALGVGFGLPKDKKLRKAAGVVLFIAAPFVLGQRLELLTYNSQFYLPMAMQWNLGIMYLLEVLVLFITHSPAFGVVFTNVVLTVLYSANYFVLMYRGTSLRMNDFAAIGTAADVVGDFDLTPNVHLAMAWGILAVVVVYGVQTTVWRLDGKREKQETTGDVGGKGESSLLKRMEKYGIGQVSLLKVAHHGSRYTSSEDFLKEVRPSLSVISCGKKNRYGHPHEEVLKRLQQVKSQILDTPTYGAVVVEVGKKITLKTWKTSGN